MKKTAKKQQKSRLTHEEKLEVCRLLGSGYSMNEVTQTMSRKTGKSISLWQVRHYLDASKWLSFIRAARKDDVLHAELIPIFSTTGRVKKYSRMLEIFEEKFQQSLQNIELKNLNPKTDPGIFKIFNTAASYMLKILGEIREEKYAAIAKKGDGDEGEIEDLFMLVERRIIASRKRRDPDRELERAAGLI